MCEYVHVNKFWSVLMTRYSFSFWISPWIMLRYKICSFTNPKFQEKQNFKNRFVNSRESLRVSSCRIAIFIYSAKNEYPEFDMRSFLLGSSWCISQPRHFSRFKSLKHWVIRYWKNGKESPFTWTVFDSSLFCWKRVIANLLVCSYDTTSPE